jgi:hypothetical protein
LLTASISSTHSAGQFVFDIAAKNGMILGFMQGGFVMKKCVLLLLALAFTACSFADRRASSSYTVRPIPSGSSIGIVIDAPNAMKNIVLMRFMAKGYAIKAINANDIYTLSDYFGIKDFKYLAYKEKLPVVSADEDQPITSAQKSFDSIFKLNIYNYELSKAETLRVIREKWDVRYLVILEMSDWETFSWGRAIDLSTMDVIWVNNYKTAFNDSPESLADHFIASVSAPR